MVLLTCLDALANHWHATSDPAAVPRDLGGADRMRHFLDWHGQHEAFSRVSAPRLRAWGTPETERFAAASSFPFSRYGRAQLQEVATWRDDPTFASLEPLATDRSVLVNCSYGGIIYEGLSRDAHLYVPEECDPEDDGPSYVYVYNSREFHLTIPAPFLADTLKRAIESFEAEAGERGALPFGPRKPAGRS